MRGKGWRPRDRYPSIPMTRRAVCGKGVAARGKSVADDDRHTRSTKPIPRAEDRSKQQTVLRMASVPSDCVGPRLHRTDTDRDTT